MSASGPHPSRVRARRLSPTQATDGEHIMTTTGPQPDDDVVLARLGGAHGLRGDLKADIRTDELDRLAPGEQVRTDPESHGPLTISALRRVGQAMVIRFEQTRSREAAEALRGVRLVASPRSGGEEEAWYPSELVGLRTEGTDGRLLGEVVGVQEAPAHEYLVLREPSGARTLVPFVSAIVPVVDVAAGRVVLDPPGGLLADEPLPEEETPPGGLSAADDT